jgi:hypothetical protein
MSSENPHLLEKEIHTTFDWDNSVAEAFSNRIDILIEESYPVIDSQHYHMFEHIVRELNRKLDKFGLSSIIVDPFGAGFRPSDLNDFIEEISENYLDLEDSYEILQENGFKILLEQDFDYLEAQDGNNIVQSDGFRLII